MRRGSKGVGDDDALPHTGSAAVSSARVTLVTMRHGALPDPHREVTFAGCQLIYLLDP